MAIASTRTLLPLDMFAKILGISPAHFNGGYAPSLTPQVFPLQNSCSDLWFQYAWQSFDRVSREDIAFDIVQAEREISRLLGYFPAPDWVVEESHIYPRPYRREYYGSGYDTRLQRKSFSTKMKKVISPGRRAVSLVGTATTAGATLAYSDPDLDGFSELATITLATSLTDVSEIKVYVTGHSGDPAYEIRPVKSKTISGGNVIITIDSWMMIEPSLWEEYPTDQGMRAIDMSSIANFVTSVDVYREYNDTTQASVQFFWDTQCLVCGGSGCAVCSPATQNGCFTVRDPDLGVIVPFPATYDSDTSSWVQQPWVEGREPDRVKIYYYCGDKAQEYSRGFAHEPINLQLARAITYLAVARAERDFCECGNIGALSQWLRQDLTYAGQGDRFILSFNFLDNPFGTRRGEVYAYRLLSQNFDRVGRYSLV